MIGHGNLLASRDGFAVYLDSLPFVVSCFTTSGLSRAGGLPSSAVRSPFHWYRRDSILAAPKSTARAEGWPPICWTSLAAALAPRFPGAAPDGDLHDRPERSLIVIR
jgi:hypothetical protein